MANNYSASSSQWLVSASAPYMRVRAVEIRVACAVLFVVGLHRILISRIHLRAPPPAATPRRPQSVAMPLSRPPVDISFAYKGPRGAGPTLTTRRERTFPTAGPKDTCSPDAIPAVRRDSPLPLPCQWRRLGGY